MHEKLKRRAGSLNLPKCSLWGASLLGGAAVACAGTNTLEVDQETRDRICDTYDCGSSAGGGPIGGIGGAGGNVAGGAGGSAGSTMTLGGAGGSAGSTMTLGGAGGSTLAGGSGGMTLGGAGNAGGSGGSDACDGFMVLSTSCAGASCHGAGAGFSTFAASLSEAERFFNAPSDASGYDNCGPLIEPGNPEGSFIYLKAAATLAVGCGSPMPLGTPGLGDEDLACLESWISSL